MDAYELVDRPPRNRRRSADELEYDRDLEAALLSTLVSKRAVKLPLWKFHSSPAKGRLWSEGHKVKHRRIDLQTVAAWVE